MIPRNIFFNTIAVPEFLQKEFKAEDWFTLPARIKDILEQNINKSELKSTNSTLITNGKVYIGKNCKIAEYVVIDGPAYIGDDVEISTHAYIRPGSVIGNGCSIGHAAEVKSSIIMDGAKVANHTFVGDSIIGCSGRVGGHSETQNRLFEQNKVEINYNGEKYQTGADKFGAILGEGSRLGGGVFTAPGTLIGKNTFITSGLRVNGFIPENSFLKFIQDYEVKTNRFNKKLNNSAKYIQR